MKRHRVVVLAIGCVIFSLVALCQNDSTVSPPVGVFHVGGAVKAPRAIYSPDPEYPE
ncbi:MAG: hypothetical protein ACLPHI_21075 [Terriglobales bacterium]|jgi:hypothetical protein